MCELPVFYATTEGQTRRISERMAARIRERGVTSEALDLGSPAARAIDWGDVRGVVLGASIHGSKHPREAAEFATKFAPRLNAIPSAFFSVSMSAASADKKSVAAAETLAHEFVRQQGWRPTRVDCVAGRLAYTQYGWLKRQIMRRIARKQGGPTDSTRDHEFTDWAQVDSIAADLASRVAPAHAVSSLAS